MRVLLLAIGSLFFLGGSAAILINISFLTSSQPLQQGATPSPFPKTRTDALVGGSAEAANKSDAGPALETSTTQTSSIGPQLKYPAFATPGLGPLNSFGLLPLNPDVLTASTKPGTQLTPGLDERGITVRGLDGPNNLLDGQIADDGPSDGEITPTRELPLKNAARLPNGHVAIFDVSENTSLDPLRDKSWDLSSAKTVPTDQTVAPLDDPARRQNAQSRVVSTVAPKSTRKAMHPEHNAVAHPPIDPATPGSNSPPTPSENR